MAKLPVLMYHSVTPNHNKSKGLTISVENLETQFKHLKKAGYTSLHFKDLRAIKNAKHLPKKPIIITFDDVYVNQLELAYPLLKKYKLKACWYVPFKYVGGENAWDNGKEPIMSIDQLKDLDTSIIELGWHSFSHQNYKILSVAAVNDDLNACQKFIDQHQLKVENILAYPYGKYPKSGNKKEKFFNVLKQHNISYALRIGNRVNTYPFKNPHEIQRIDIKGEDSLTTFKLKLKFGKLKLF